MNGQKPRGVLRGVSLTLTRANRLPREPSYAGTENAPVSLVDARLSWAST